MSTLNMMTRKEILETPDRGWGVDIGLFDSLVIVPGRSKHDSSFGVMSYVACKNEEPVAKLSGFSDVLHIDGISGLGDWSVETGYPIHIKPKGWSIDVLYKSKLLRLYPRSEWMLKVGLDVSSFEVIAVERKEHMK